MRDRAIPTGTDSSADLSGRAASESRRLAAVRRACLRGGEPSETFDRLTRLVATILDVPVALVSLVDVARQVFIGCRGLPEPWASARQTPLSHSFCRHIVISGSPLIIEDAREHPLLRDNPAIADLEVIAYAGIPLVTGDGDVLGSLCAIDHHPRAWTERDIAILHDLAASVMTEIELRRTRTEAEAERARLRDVFRQAPAMIALLEGPAHTYVFANDLYERGVGRGGDKLIGRSVRDALPELSGQGIYEVLDDVYANGTPYVATEMPVRLDRHGSGSLEDTRFSFVFQPIRGTEEAVRGILVHAVEVTTFVAAREQAVRLARQVEEDRDRLRRILDLLPEGVLIAEGTGRFTIANRAARDILGLDLTRGEAPFQAADLQTVFQVRLPDGSPYAPADLLTKRSLGLEEEVRAEQLLVRNVATERDIPILLNSTLLRDATGELGGAIIVFQDITRLREVERTSDEFISSIAHDLKSPLTAILGNAQLARRRVLASDQDRLRRHLDSILSSGRSLAGLIDDLLEVTRGQLQRSVAIDRADVDLGALVREVVSHLDETEHRIDLAMPSTPLMVAVEVARIERVVTNLVGNALKYSPDGGEVTIRVARGDGPDGPEALVIVRDRGIGIPAADLPHIFERFHRAANVGTIAGSGIGLASVAQIVQQHGGTVTMESTRGEGSTCTLRLPLPMGTTGRKDNDR